MFSEKIGEVTFSDTVLTGVVVGMKSRGNGIFWCVIENITVISSWLSEVLYA